LALRKTVQTRAKKLLQIRLDSQRTEQENCRACSVTCDRRERNGGSVDLPTWSRVLWPKARWADQLLLVIS